MIAKAKSIAHGKAALDYVLGKDGAELIDSRFCSGENALEYIQEFSIFQELNDRAVNKELSIVLSPEVAEGKTLTNDQYKSIADDFLKGMGLEDNQAVIVKHTDKEHTHLHLIVNRIDSNGKCYNDQNIHLHAHKQADIVAQERGLTRAKIVQEQRLEISKDVKKEIHQLHKMALNKSKDFEEYTKNMKSKGVDVVPSVSKEGNIQGYRVQYQELSFKASEVHRSMTLSRMEYEKEIEKQQEHTRERNRNNDFTR